MAHEIDHTLGFAAMAFTGDRGNIWHRLGQQAQADWTMTDWRKAAGLNWQAELIPAEFRNPVTGAMVAGDAFYNVRNDTGAAIGFGMKDGFQNVQPADVCDYFASVCSRDERFRLSTMGALKGGSIIWGLAEFNGDLTIGRDAHKAHLLMSTAFDGSAATKNQITMTRVVCNNTLRAAHGDTSALVKTRHSTRFDGERVSKMLGQLAQSVDKYKAIGDAMVENAMGETELKGFFKALLDIPATAAKEDISTRKLNIYRDLGRAYITTVRDEGAPKDTAWAALQAVTRYVDHDRTTRNTNGTSSDESRVMSSTFGSGDAMKGQAMQLLMPRIRDKVAVLAS